jgi:hypothetical protein
MMCPTSPPRPSSLATLSMVLVVSSSGLAIPYVFPIVPWVSYAPGEGRGVADPQNSSADTTLITSRPLRPFMSNKVRSNVRFPLYSPAPTPLFPARTISGRFTISPWVPEVSGEYTSQRISTSRVYKSPVRLDHSTSKSRSKSRSFGIWFIRISAGSTICSRRRRCAWSISFCLL